MASQGVPERSGGPGTLSVPRPAAGVRKSLRDLASRGGCCALMLSSMLLSMSMCLVCCSQYLLFVAVQACIVVVFTPKWRGVLTRTSSSLRTVRILTHNLSPRLSSFSLLRCRRRLDCYAGCRTTHARKSVPPRAIRLPPARLNIVCFRGECLLNSKLAFGPCL